jgi:hypothetical protein
MLKTLGLDDDLDSVEVVVEIEKAFDIEISAGDPFSTLANCLTFSAARCKPARQIENAWARWPCIESVGP